MNVSDEQEYDIVQPAAAAMIESMRAYGYTLETAIADIIDNSITARSGNVWLTFHWDGADSYISILDDGHGMSGDELKNAMRPGSRNPLEERDPADMGRFGLGLKTSSFSQCRRLTVASKRKGGAVSIRRWDLDHVMRVDEWQLLRSPHEGSWGRLKGLDKLDSGTLVLWERMDRVVGDVRSEERRAHNLFLQRCDEVEDHIEMVFHRYLDPSRNRMKVFINGEGPDQMVKPWDPFMQDHHATIPTPPEPISCGPDTVDVQGFILPHKDKLTEEEFERGGGPSGWNAQQGYYVYRNERMLVPGSWLRLGRQGQWAKAEHMKLARLRLDLPNSADMDWQIDVKKSTATPPSLIRYRLRDLAEDVRDKARRVFAHRGQYGPRPAVHDIERIWNSVVKDGRKSYRIDRRNPLVMAVIAGNRENRMRVNALLRVIEETVPVERIWLDTAEGESDPSRPFEALPTEEVEGVIGQVYNALITHDGLSPEEARRRMLSMEAFLDHRDYISSMDTTEEEE